MSAVVSGCDHSTDFSDFDALTITRTGSFELDMTPDEAQPLFTAPGERLWISIWDPAILHGDGYENGTAFVTNNHGDCFTLRNNLNIFIRKAYLTKLTG